MAKVINQCEIFAIYDNTKINSSQYIYIYQYNLPYLHVSILDSIVNHLDIMSCSILADPVAARLLANLGSDALEDGLDVFPRLRVTTWHERGAVASTVLSPAHSATDEEETLLSKELGTTLHVCVCVCM